MTEYRSRREFLGLMAAGAVIVERPLLSINRPSERNLAVAVFFSRAAAALVAVVS
jgi:hypothetical protein